VIDRMRALRLRGEAGHSLIELLTVMVIMSIVMAGITGVFVSGSKAQAEQDRRFQAQVGTRLALDRIRRDIHCANGVTPYATNAVTLKLSASCGNDVSWCTSAVTGYTNRYRLYRQLGGPTCGPTGGIMVADYLTRAAAFPEFLHPIGCKCLASLRVDFVVSVKGSTIDAYELTDTIYLRNSGRV
jgi:prepilin-type N-terminal cleavage/methylation domain-containing protein